MHPSHSSGKETQDLKGPVPQKDPQAHGRSKSFDLVRGDSILTPQQGFFGMRSLAWHRNSK